MYEFVHPYKVPTKNWPIQKLVRGLTYLDPGFFNFSFSMRLYQHNMAMRRRLQLFCRNIVSLILPVDSKGALLVLLWSTMMFIYQFFVISYAANDSLIAVISPHADASYTAPATGNIKMKRVCFRTKRVCFSSANVGVVFSLSLETRRKSPLVPCSVYSWIIHGILKAFPFVIFCTLKEIFVDVSNKTWYIYRLLSLRAPYL